MTHATTRRKVARITRADQLVIAYRGAGDSLAAARYRALNLAIAVCERAGIDLSKPHEEYCDSNGDIVYAQDAGPLGDVGQPDPYDVREPVPMERAR